MYLHGSLVQRTIDSKMRQIVRHSQAISASLHPATRERIRRLTDDVDRHYRTVLQSHGWAIDLEGSGAHPINRPEQIAIWGDKLVSRHLLPTYDDAFALTDGLWSVARAMVKIKDQGGDRTDPAQTCADLFVDACDAAVKTLCMAANSDLFKVRLGVLASRRGYAEELILPLHHIFATGPVSEDEFAQMLGRRMRQEYGLLQSRLISDRLLVQDDSGKLSIDFPLHVVGILLPGVSEVAP